MNNIQTEGNKVSQKKKWGRKEKAEWLSKQVIKRSYYDDIVVRIESLTEDFDVHQYGALSFSAEKYPLYIITTPLVQSKKNILVTGGVHGYETSGVHGALRFLETEACYYRQHFNLIVVPCVSPWGYETINRWNPDALDPNRSFYPDSQVEESAFLMAAIAKLEQKIYAHIDLHETTDTDNSEFMPALAARDAEELVVWEIPDGFYTVGDSDNPVDEFQKAIIDAVRKVTHIAPSDAEGNIIGEPTTQQGVINYAKKQLGLCAGFTQSHYPTTTEVYPDSAKATPEDCIKAQVAAIKGGLDYLIAIENVAD